MIGLIFATIFTCIRSNCRKPFSMGSPNHTHTAQNLDGGELSKIAAAKQAYGGLKELTFDEILPLLDAVSKSVEAEGGGGAPPTIPPEADTTPFLGKSAVHYDKMGGLSGTPVNIITCVIFWSVK